MGLVLATDWCIMKLASLVDFVDRYTMSWEELGSVPDVQLSRLADDLDRDSLTASSRILVGRLFEVANTRHHLDMVRASGIFSLIALQLFIFLDALIIPDVLWFSVVVKLGIITPLGLYCILNAHRRSAYIDILALSNYVIGEVMVLGFMYFSTEPFAWVYVFGISLICINANLFQSVPSKSALVMTVLSLVLIIIGLALSPLDNLAVAGLVFCISSCMCLFSLFGNFRIETGYRRQYMAALKEKFRADQLNVHNRKLSQDVALDGLTGIFNRRYLDEKLAEYCKEHSQNAQPLGILLIDVDHFKKLNDQHGHLAGDTCLRHLASVLFGGVRTPADLVARFGGEEFVILLPRCDLTESLNVAERLRFAVESARIDVDSVIVPLRLTISIGCHAAVPIDGHDPDQFVSSADAALYMAKRNGRNKVCVVEETGSLSLWSRLGENARLAP